MQHGAVTSWRHPQRHCRLGKGRFSGLYSGAKRMKKKKGVSCPARINKKSYKTEAKDKMSGC